MNSGLNPLPLLKSGLNSGGLRSFIDEKSNKIEFFL